MRHIKSEFEKKLKELGFSYKSTTDGPYILYKNNDSSHILTAQLGCSEPIVESDLGSRNGALIQAIGYFKLRIQTEVKDPDYFILAFKNTSNHCVEFIVIPKEELKRRLIEGNRISTDVQETEIVFWLMPDNRLYETTDVGIEWEWYYLSPGLHGRMADRSLWDYAEYLNSWDTLNHI